MLHGSGPSVVARNHLAAWRRTTKKPYGIYGVTVGEVDDELRQLLSGADFVFRRDIGLEPWIFEIDETRAEDISARLLELHADYPAAQARLAKAMRFVAQRQRESMAVVGQSLKPQAG